MEIHIDYLIWERWETWSFSSILSSETWSDGRCVYHIWLKNYISFNLCFWKEQGIKALKEKSVMRKTGSHCLKPQSLPWAFLLGSLSNRHLLHSNKQCCRVEVKVDKKIYEICMKISTPTSFWYYCSLKCKMEKVNWYFS